MDERRATLPVRRVVEHNPSYKSFYVEDKIGGEPGQFAMLWLPGVDEKPISFSDRADGLLELTVKAIGPFTKAMMAVKPGDLLGVRGPYGRGFALAENALVVGGGCGVAPLRFLGKRLVKQGLRPTLVLAARTRSELLFADELAGASADPGAFLQVCTDDGSMGRRGLVTEKLDEVIERRRPACVCAAGPEVMLVAVRDVARRHALPVQLSVERYMKCGIGLCGQCCLDPSGLRACVEGPVLDDALLAQVGELGMPHRDASGTRRKPGACER